MAPTQAVSIVARLEEIWRRATSQIKCARSRVIDIDSIGLFVWSKRHTDALEDASVFSQIIAMLSTGLIAPMCSASNAAVTSIAYSHENTSK